MGRIPSFRICSHNQMIDYTIAVFVAVTIVPSHGFLHVLSGVPVHDRIPAHQEWRKAQFHSSIITALNCQLLGINSGDPTAFSLSWPSFCERGGLTDIHADGWGLAYYQGDCLRQFHDVEPASTSALAQFLGQQSIDTKNMLAHIRYATAGQVDLANVHPFSREMWGIQWCFCHNGQVPLFEDHPDWSLCGSINDGDHANVEDGDSDDHDDRLCRTVERTYSPIGTTDSEAAFCAILNALRAKFTDSMPSLPILYEELKVLCQEIVDYEPKTTIFNFLLTCGPHLLWVYSWPGARPGSKVWNGLHYTIRNRKNDDTTTRLSCSGDDPNYAVAIGTAAYKKTNGASESINGTRDSSSINDSENQVCLVATKPLTSDEEWIELERGELLVMDAGAPKVSAVDLFRAELNGKGLSAKVLQPPHLEEDMRRYQFEPTFFAGGGI